MKLSEKIFALRRQKGMSQEKLAEELNISRQSISRWENGTAQPDAENIFLLSRIFGITADSLLDEEQDVSADSLSTDRGQERFRRLFPSAAGAVLFLTGLLGNFVIYVLSRMFKVMIPNITREYDGTIIYRWSSGITGYSYKYFIQEHHLELLTALLWLMLACGLILLLRKPIRTQSELFCRHRLLLSPKSIEKRRPDLCFKE